jgi:hypothetical protein
MYKFNCDTSLQKSFLLIVVCLFILINKSVKAQQLTMNGGLSVPISYYSKSDFPLFENGFAQVGQYATFQYEQAFRKTVGIFVGANYNYNSVNQTDFTKLVKVGNKDLTNTTSTSNWSQLSLMGGLKFSKATAGYALFSKIGIGMSWMNSPGNNLILNDSVMLKWNTSSVVKEMFCAGVGFSIPINESVSFQMNGDVLFGFPDFGIIKITDAGGSSATNTNSSLIVPFSTIQIGTGLIFNLDQIKNK